jgi:AraC-like DNA-binding protein
MGGVARYILHRRLQRAFHALANPANRRLRIAEVASRVGFASESHFSRAFRSAFGLTPSDIRGASSGKGAPAFMVGSQLVPSAQYAAWVLGLQGG